MNVRFPNFWSRWFLRGMFERQFIIPEDPPWHLETPLWLIERYLMRVKLPEKVDRPIFLLGLPRSGTTMVQDLCCSHPQLAFVTNAMHQFPSCFCAAEVLRRWLRLDASGERHLGDGVVVEAGSPNEGIRLWARWFGWDPYDPVYRPREFSQFTPEQIEQIHTALRKIVWCHGGRRERFFSKNPALTPDLPLLPQLFPDARFVHLIRDPRQCANSMVKLYHLEQEQLDRIRAQRKHGVYDDRPFVPYPRVPKLAEYLERWGPADVRTTARVWQDCVNIVCDCEPELPNLLTVRFEDVLADPAGQFARLFEFCELDPIERDNEPFWNKIAKVGRTRHKNTYGEFEVIEEICAETMPLFGYKPGQN